MTNRIRQVEGKRLQIHASSSLRILASPSGPMSF